MENIGDYLVEYEDSSGKRYQVQTSRTGLLELVREEERGIEILENRDGFMIPKYNSIRIFDIVSSDGWRPRECFNLGISVADKYNKNVHGYFIKDTRTKFKALAPGTNAVLIFSDRKSAEEYYNKNKDLILDDYSLSKDNPYFRYVIYHQNLVNENQPHHIDFSDKGKVFPENDIYTRSDAHNLLSLMDVYVKFHAENNKVCNLMYTRENLSKFIMENAKSINDEYWIPLDKFDDKFKMNLTMFVLDYSDMVNYAVKVRNEEIMTAKQSGGLTDNKEIESSDNLER